MPRGSGIFATARADRCGAGKRTGGLPGKPCEASWALADYFLCSGLGTVDTAVSIDNLSLVPANPR